MLLLIRAAMCSSLRDHGSNAACGLFTPSAVFLNVRTISMAKESFYLLYQLKSSSVDVDVEFPFYTFIHPRQWIFTSLSGCLIWIFGHSRAFVLTLFSLCSHFADHSHELRNKA